MLNKAVKVPSPLLVMLTSCLATPITGVQFVTLTTN